MNEKEEGGDSSMELINPVLSNIFDTTGGPQKSWGHTSELKV